MKSTNYQLLYQTPLIIIHPPNPSMIAHVPVNTPAKALSPVVAGVTVPTTGFPVVPALGFPALVPPVLFVTGPGTYCTRFEFRTLRSERCSPTPRARPS